MTNPIIEKIQKAQTIDELDRISIDYFSNVEENDMEYDRDIDLAFHKRESEILNMKNVAADIMDLIRGKTMEESDTNNIVPFDLTKRKIKVQPEDVVEILPPSLMDIKCKCEIKYGVQCIHKTMFSGILPHDYEYCPDCGCDHFYDKRLAEEVHQMAGIYYEMEPHD